MSKQFLETSDQQPSLKSSYKILPLKRVFITFRSWVSYYREKNQIAPYLVKNPKWCNLNLKHDPNFGYEEMNELDSAKSLRLLSVHFESYYLDSQACGDHVDTYAGELNRLERFGDALKKLSLSVAFGNSLACRNDNDRQVEDEYSFMRLERFTKKQKHLEELGLHAGSPENSKRMAPLLRCLEKTLKVLTIGNICTDDFFKGCTFPKLRVLRFEYILFYGSEMSFDFSILAGYLKMILSLPSLETLVFSQYQRYNLGMYVEGDGFVGDDDEDSDEEEDEEDEEEREEEEDEEDERNKDDNEKAQDKDSDSNSFESDSSLSESPEFPKEFWKLLRDELDKNKKKQIKVLYHLAEEVRSVRVEEKTKMFKKLFAGLAPGQTFIYEVRNIPKDKSGFGARLTMPQGITEKVKL